MSFSKRGTKKLVSLIAISLVSAILCACIPDTAYGVINGAEVKGGTVLANSIAMLYNTETTEVCTVSLLSNNHALTAAHCVYGHDASVLRVFFSTAPNTQKDPYRQVVATQYSRYWEKRKNKPQDTGDIAVIRFEGDRLPNGYKPVNMLEDYSVLKAGTPITIAGYGLNDASNSQSFGVLRGANMSILDPEFGQTEISLDQSKGFGICHGDSGGPAFVYINKQYYLWGVANRSVNDDDDLCNDSAAMTNASVYMAWVLMMVNSL